MSEIVVPSTGPRDARTLLVGESPGEYEEKFRIPFYPDAPSGKQITRALGGPGARAQVRLTNASLTRPPHKEKPEAKMARLRRWLPALEEEYTGSEAKAVCLVGEDAFKVTLGARTHLRAMPGGKWRREDERGISLWHGSVITRAEAEAMRSTHESKWPLVAALPPNAHSFVVTLHPAFAMRGKQAFAPSIRANIGRAVRWAAKPAGPVRPPEEWFHLTPEPGEVEAALRQADEAREPWALDVETPHDNHHFITTLGVATGRGVWAFPWGGRFRDVVRDALARPGVVVGHNFAFDLDALAAYGIQPADRTGRACVDTIVAAARLEPPFEGSDKARWLALASCVKRMLDGVAFWKKPEWATTRAIYKVNWPRLCEEWMLERLYCGLDNFYTRLLWKVQRQLLAAENML